MKKKVFGIAILVLFFAIFLVISIGNTTNKAQIFAMDTYCEIEISGSKKLLNQAEQILCGFDEKFDALDENSDVYSMNLTSETTDKEIVSLVNKLIEYNKKTNGAFDFSMKKLSEEWGFYKKEVKEPEKIDFSTFGADKVEVENGTVKLHGAELDFGAVLKGYATDEIAKYLCENGVKKGIINLGGNVYAFGREKIGVQSPNKENSLACAVDVCGEAVVTSGIYQRRYTDDKGIERHHILDPKTGYPAQSGLVSVTVVGKNAMECDVLSTAFLVLGKDETKKLMENFDVEVILIDENNNLYVSGGIFDKTVAYEGYEKERL